METNKDDFMQANNDPIGAFRIDPKTGRAFLLTDRDFRMGDHVAYDGVGFKAVGMGVGEKGYKNMYALEFSPPLNDSAIDLMRIGQTQQVLNIYQEACATEKRRRVYLQRTPVARERFIEEALIGLTGALKAKPKPEDPKELGYAHYFFN